MSKGANGRGGWRYQTLAMFLTYTAIVSSYAPYVIQGFRERSAQDAVQQTAPTDSLVASDSATAATAGAVKLPAPGVGAIILALAALLLLFYATPIIVGVQSPITLLILGIALYEAWKLNKNVELRITGPYQVARGATSA